MAGASDGLSQHGLSVVWSLLRLRDTQTPRELDCPLPDLPIFTGEFFGSPAAFLSRAGLSLLF
jgi:hypothetical protein